MPHPIYHFGYTGRDLEDITSRIAQSGAILVDIRYSPRSRVPSWRQAAFEKHLGRRYRWKGDLLGNRNYGGGPVDIVDLSQGLQFIQDSARQCPVVIMCVCAKVEGCHRQPILLALQEAGFEVIDGLPETEDHL